ncbi:hypothetical protein K7X08_026232 [Anisodus acutangulus]|uniref:Uncharacterized protein n=1 Tax=Anisodus acutangulus TaxID=402998 RepID=A0A9Q1N265_9SOLA|nr:hypothetical protein K7X08_026232 [Anisodus acutangulus]
MICMNELCRTTASTEWKKGWSLKTGGFAKLCYNCGLHLQASENYGRGEVEDHNKQQEKNQVETHNAFDILGNPEEEKHQIEEGDNAESNKSAKKGSTTDKNQEQCNEEKTVQKSKSLQSSSKSSKSGKHKDVEEAVVPEDEINSNNNEEIMEGKKRQKELMMITWYQAAV